jgi:serine/threonine protein kinase
MTDPSESTTRILDAAAADPMVGRQVRDFRVLERIGRGGMGSVYKAEHRLLREPRALKVMRAELFHAMPQAVERFEREARIAVKLRHPNLVLLHDFFVEDGDRFLVMEYVVGKSLATLMREQGALSVDETCRIGLQICAGLGYAHEMGIVHRDLSPENVMITPSPSGPQVKIIDFGVARAAFANPEGGSEEDATLTRVGQFIGKPRYASPEQAGSLRRGESLDQRSDLYTVGLMLFEMLTERFPFQSESDLGYLAKHSFEAPASLRRTRPDLEIPPALERVILHCLEKDRARRFASAQELGAALEWAWHSGDPRTAPFGRDPRADDADSEPTRPMDLPVYEPPPDRRPALIAGAVALTLLGVVAGGAALWFSTRDDARPAVVAKAVAEPAAPTPAALAAKVEPEPEPEPQARSEPELAPEPEPVPVAQPMPEKRADDEKRAELAAAGLPVQEPAPPVEKPEPASRPSPPAEVAVERPKPPAPVAAPAFADAAEMQRAFDEALAYESSHPATASIANWKRFRSRSPSHELDERAKRRITDLTLGNLRGYP